MDIQRFNGEVDEMVELLCSNEWTYHSRPQLDSEAVRQSVLKGYYENGRETYWILNGNEKVGILVIDDIDDTIPLFDIRLSSKARGQNIGTQALEWMRDYLFGELGKVRIEGYTRADNYAMRKCFTKADFVKEGYLRNAWENEDGTISDTVLYGAIYDDWKENKVTPTRINEEDF